MCTGWHSKFILSPWITGQSYLNATLQGRAGGFQAGLPRAQYRESAGGGLSSPRSLAPHHSSSPTARLPHQKGLRKGCAGTSQTRTPQIPRTFPFALILLMFTSKFTGDLLPSKPAISMDVLSGYLTHIPFETFCRLLHSQW